MMFIPKSGKRDSDPRPRPWQGRALPTELFPRGGNCEVAESNFIKFPRGGNCEVAESNFIKFPHGGNCEVAESNFIKFPRIDLRL